MENNSRIINEYVTEVLEQVSSLMEKWEPYVEAREKLWNMLEDSSRYSQTPEEKQTLLMDYEMSLILASYLMGLHEGKAADNHTQETEKILEILDHHSPLIRQQHMG